MIRVVLADDDERVRTLLATVLAAAADVAVVRQVGDGLAALEAARTARPDVLVLDLRMPGIDGLEVTRRLLADTSGAPAPVPRVLILTAFDGDESVREALRLGASGYLLTSDAPDLLLPGIRAVARGDAVLHPGVTRRLLPALLPAASSSSDEVTRRRRLEAALTKREREVWLLLARGLSNAECAAELVVSENTVVTHVARLLRKLGVRDRLQAAVLAHEVGALER